MGANFSEHGIVLVEALVQAFSCLVQVHAGLMAFLSGRVVIHGLRCADVVEGKLLCRDSAPHLGAVMRLVLPVRVPLLLEGYESGFVVELYQVAFRSVVAIPEGLLPHQLPKSVAVVIKAAALRSLLLGCQDHSALRGMH